MKPTVAVVWDGIIHGLAGTIHGGLVRRRLLLLARTAELQEEVPSNYFLVEVSNL
jgi:hypothetical protein